MANSIEIYQNNTKRVTCIVSGLDVTGYNSYITVRKNISDASVMTNTGTVSDASTLIFNISSTDTSLNVGSYVYDITVQLDSSIYTLVKDTLSILNGVKY